MTNLPNLKKLLSTAASVLAFTAAALAQKAPFSNAGTAQPAPEPGATAAAPTLPDAKQNAVEKFLDGEIPDAKIWGKINLNARLRFEYAEEQGVAAIKEPSYAPTIRTRLGYTTPSLYGFQGMLEGENIAVIGPAGNYNAAGSNGKGYRPVVADPPLTRLDQAWLGYRYENYVTARVGEQHIVLDNQRFIGDVDWRQNWQTYEAAGIGSQPVTNLNLYYGYVWDVHRPFGNVGGLAAANRDFDSSSHLINIAYSGWKYGRFVGYNYLLGLTNAGGSANSCATYGGYFAGAAPVGDEVTLDYRAEYAWQTDYGRSALRYGADYYNLELGANIKPVAFGAGYEDMGSGVNNGKGGGRASFRTPLATFHGFDGWADMFLATPANGLQNSYAYMQVTLPAQIPLRFVYHKFDAAFGGGNYGQEFDVMASKKFGKHWTSLLEYAFFDGQDAAAPAVAAKVNMQKFWAQVEFNF